MSVTRDEFEQLIHRVERIEERIGGAGPTTVAMLYTALSARFDQVDAEQGRLADKIMDTQRMILDAVAAVDEQIGRVHARLDDLDH